MSSSALVNYTKISPNSSARTAKIDKITIHHMAGNLSVEACGNVFATTDRQASSNYGIGSDGRIGLYVDESRRAWTSSNRDNDNRAVTIEVANSGGAPSWPVSDKALAATINLCVDICKRNGIARLNYTGDKNGNLTMHKWFAYTLCPGPYLESKFQYIADEVNRQLGSAGGTNRPTYDTPATVWHVQVGAFSKKDSAERKMKELLEAGFTDTFVACVESRLWRVQVGSYASRAEATSILSEVQSAGFTGFVTQLSGLTEQAAQPAKKSDDDIAKEVVSGKWGNGAERIKRLTEAGYDPGVIQAKVNAIMRK